MKSGSPWPFGDLPRASANVIYADPAWRYSVFSKKGEAKSASRHYETMPLADICALPVADLAAPSAHLFLWATAPHLRQAFTVMDAWGFSYSSVAFVWGKLNRSHQISPRLFLADCDAFMGMGHTTRQNAEFVLLGRRGAPKRKVKSIRQMVFSPVREHSRKPDEVRALIERYADGPRVELFARTKADGWMVWGNETSKFGAVA